MLRENGYTICKLDNMDWKIEGEVNWDERERKLIKIDYSVSTIIAAFSDTRICA